MCLVAIQHVIVADDDPGVRALVARVVARLMPNAAISSVEHGRAALEAYTARPADLLVTDFMMPELDGAELIAALEARGVTLPTLLLTAALHIPPEFHAYAHVRVLRKPFDIDQLEAAIRGLVAPQCLSVAK